MIPSVEPLPTPPLGVDPVASRVTLDLADTGWSNL